MSLFNRKPKHSVCSQCGIHFEPPQDEINKMFGNMCGIHREPLVARERKIREVAKWARDNWETLYPKYEKDKKKQAEAMQKTYASQGSTRAISGCTCHSSLNMQQMGIGIYGW